MSATLTVSAGAATHAGRRRRLNEDAYLAQDPVFLVADGMGGHEAGDRASAAVIAEFAALVGASEVRADEVQVALRRARGAVEGMPLASGASAGTTLSGVVIAAVEGVGYWLTVNVGDSRTYRLAGGELEQITVDHSVVQELVDAGLLSRAEARADSRRNIITRAIGAGSSGDADFWMLPAEPGDRVLVCSDGLPAELDDDRIRELLMTVPEPQRVAEALVAEAVAAGGRDNVTVVVVDVLSATSPAGASSEEWLDADTMPRERITGGMS